MSEITGNSAQRAVLFTGTNFDTFVITPSWLNPFTMVQSHPHSIASAEEAPRSLIGSEYMHRRPRAAKYRSPRSIAAITEGIIDEFGAEEGPVRMCIGICQTLFEHPDDPTYIQDFNRWTSVVNQVCAQREIAFNAERVCADIISEIWNASYEAVSRREAELAQPQLAFEEVPPAFEELVQEADMIHARGLGISLNN